MTNKKAHLTRQSWSFFCLRMTYTLASCTILFYLGHIINDVFCSGKYCEFIMLMGVPNMGLYILLMFPLIISGEYFVRVLQKKSVYQLIAFRLIALQTLIVLAAGIYYMRDEYTYINAAIWLLTGLAAARALWVYHKKNITSTDRMVE